MNRDELFKKTGITGITRERVATFWSHVNKTEACWLWTAGQNHSVCGNYGAMIINGKHFKAHRLSWILHNGPIPEKMCACHKCDNTLCVNPDHIFLGTHSDNMRDMITKGRRDTAKGERQHSHKFTAETVLAIRAEYALGGVSHRQMSVRFGTNHSSIRKIVNRMTWKHI